MLVRRQEEVISKVSDKDENLSLIEGKNLIPQEFENILDSQIILPVKENIQEYFLKLKDLNNKVEIAKGLQVINTNSIKIKKAINSLKVMEAQEGLATIGLSGFNAIINLRLDGIQINVSSGVVKDIIQDIIRRYVMKYPSVEWPPRYENYKYFIRDSSEMQICCFYWPLYAYMLNCFKNGFYGIMDLSDLFSLEKMKFYCDKIFREQTFQGVPQSGGENKESERPDRPKFQKPEFQKQKQAPIVKVAGLGKFCEPSKFIQMKVVLERNDIKLKIQDRNRNKIVTTSEWFALNSIVSKYVKNLSETQLIVGGMDVINFVKNEAPSSITEGTISAEHQHKNELFKEEDLYSPYKSYISKSTTIFIDPILQIPYTYDDLIRWFGYPSTQIIIKPNNPPKQYGGKKKKGEKGKQSPSKKKDIRNPVSVIKNAIVKFKQNYMLPSGMPFLEEKILEGVRRRFLKFLLSIFLKMDIMYSNIYEEFKKKEYIKQDAMVELNNNVNNKVYENVNNKVNNKVNKQIDRLKNNNIKVKLSDLVRKMNQAIEKEEDAEKRDKLIQLRDDTKRRLN